MPSEALADVRDMYMAHTMFTREFGLAPDLITGVAAGDTARAAIVADHIELIDAVLHHHHSAEDDHLWHRLLERAGTDAADIVSTMEAQHHDIDVLLTAMRDQLKPWRDCADPAEGSAIAGTIGTLNKHLTEHLAVEEKYALPLIEKHITAAEWGQMVASGAADVPPEQMPLMFGLMAYEADPGTLRDIIATLPPEVSAVIGDLAAQAFADYAVRVHGTPTPKYGSAQPILD
ncbi:hemerythrin domain-containing protein [Kribbella sp. NPDC051620]|uniref:hemerythrin domain-containing protein n=1 Tax=Kribbella sp. NPDC051620 TaxID=3364120 RepID=UPI0037881E96